MSQPPDPFEFMKNLWAPMGLPGVLAPTLDVDEVERRIAELKSVENWLNMNLAALRMTIQGLEMQRATLSAMRGAAGAAAQPAADAGSDPGEAGRRLAEAWWNMLRQASSTGSGPATGSGPSTSSGRAPTGSGQSKEPEKK
jgi:hypothetical protein